MLTYTIIRNNLEILNTLSHKEPVTLTCCFCGITYEKTKHYIQKDYRRGCNNYCSRTCSSLAQTKREDVKCSECGTSLNRSPNLENRYFCSKSCSAKNNNKLRSDESRSKQKASLELTLDFKFPSRHEPKIKSPKIKSSKTRSKERAPRARNPYSRKVWGPYSKLFLLTCAHSGDIFVSRCKTKYSPKYRHLYSRDGRAAYAFTFNVYNYPDLFDIDLINKLGWYSVGGNNKKPINKTGCSRDHIISVNDAIKNNYDPYYIRHPMNCRILSQLENTKKKTRSDLSYEELVKKVNDFDQEKCNK